MAKFNGYSTMMANNRSAVAYAKGYIARRVREAAEEEIQAAIATIESRIRTRVSQSFDCAIGDISMDFDPMHQGVKVAVRVHLSDRAPTSQAPRVDLGTGELLLSS